MEYKQVLVSEELHRRVKAHAALAGESIMEYTEKALRRRMDQDTPTLLVDQGIEYEAIATP